MKYLTVLVCVCLTHFSSQLLLDDSEGGDSSNENIETTTTVTTEIPTPVPTDMHEPSDQKREYKLQLTINEDKFNGTLQVDEGKHNYSDPIKVKYNSTALKISYCKCLNGIHHDLGE